MIDLKGNIYKLIKTPIDPYFSLQPGWAEQEPDYYWNNLAATARKLLNSHGVRVERIAGVSLTCQRTTNEYRDSADNIVGYLPFNYKRQTWSKARDMRWKFFQMYPSVLPELVKPGDVWGILPLTHAGKRAFPKVFP